MTFVAKLAAPDERRWLDGLRARFDHYVRRHPDGCWHWTGATNIGRKGARVRGTPIFGLGRKFGGESRNARIAAYILHVDPTFIAVEGVVFQNDCPHADCVNPDHFELVLPGETPKQRDLRRLDQLARRYPSAEALVLRLRAHIKKLATHPVA